MALWPWLCRVWFSHRHLSLLLFPKTLAAFLKEAGSWIKNQALTSFGIRLCFSSLPFICPSSWMLNCLNCLQKACVVSVVVPWEVHLMPSCSSPTYCSSCQFTLRFLWYNSHIENLLSFTSPFASLLMFSYRLAFKKVAYLNWDLQTLPNMLRWDHEIFQVGLQHRVCYRCGWG